MFKPMLAVAPEELEDIPLPTLVSTKLDGIRCIFIDGQMLSRSLKPIRNSYLQDKYQAAKVYSKDYNCILDGEFYSHELSFQEITSVVMSSYKIAPTSLSYWAFDHIQCRNFNAPFSNRIEILKEAVNNIEAPIVVLDQVEFNNHQAIENHFKLVQKHGYEGLIARPKDSRYKLGRSTLKEGLMLKLKPWKHFDAQIIAVTQATEARVGSEKTINELGRSITSKKLEDRIPIEQAACFTVKHNGYLVDVTIYGEVAFRVEIWNNRESYLTKWIEYMAMMIGAKNVPRHARLYRFRKDKD